MYRTRPQDLPELKVIDLTPARIVVIVATVFMFFVIPITVITQYKNDPQMFEKIANNLRGQPQQTGQVAGATTTTKKEEPSAPKILGLEVDMNKESGIVFMVGLLLVGISIILIIFLVVDNMRYRKYLKK